MTQLRAGIKKEWLELSRTWRLLGLLLAFFGLAVADPLLMRGMAFLMKILQDSPSMAMLDGMPEIFNQEIGVSAFVGDCASTAGLVTLLLLMRTAGGEQKKRCTVIPITLGFSRETYIYAKFLVYPPFIFLLTLASYFLSYGVSSLVFPHHLGISEIILPAFCLAFFMAYQVCLYLGLGCATGKAGIFVAVLYLISSLVPTVLNTAGWNRYNPYALIPFGANFNNPDPIEASVCIGIAVTLSLVSLVLSTMVFRKKKLV